jgi:hypothetical protein
MMTPSSGIADTRTSLRSLRNVEPIADMRGADKFVRAGYYPVGIELDRRFSGLKDLPLKEAVWPEFMSGDARRTLKLPEAPAH